MTVPQSNNSPSPNVWHSPFTTQPEEQLIRSINCLPRQSVERMLDASVGTFKSSSIVDRRMQQEQHDRRMCHGVIS
ncbi:hypothetical protein TNCV_4480081 [Trichonephila clavipes]|nr:hypothetical protein TNCV_4480081 [Trichonephila clavipes]